jgi:hypothetical protein
MSKLNQLLDNEKLDNSEENSHFDSIQDSNSQDHKDVTRNNVIGVLIMLGTGTSFGIMGFMIQLSYHYNSNLSAGDVLLVRSTIMFPFYYTYAKCNKINLFDINQKCALILFMR